MITERAAEHWDLELDDLFLASGHRFRRVEPRRRVRAYVRGPLAPVARKNSRQPAEHTGHAPADGPQHPLADAQWDPDEIRDDLQEFLADKLSEDGKVLTIDDTGFVKEGTTSVGVQRQHSPAPPAAPRIPHRACPQPDRRLRRPRHYPRPSPRRNEVGPAQAVKDPFQKGHFRCPCLDGLAAFLVPVTQLSLPLDLGTLRLGTDHAKWKVRLDVESYGVGGAYAKGSKTARGGNLQPDAMG